MARRATFFSRVRESLPSKQPFLVLGGGYEFGRQALGSKDYETLKNLQESYALLGYDLGLLTGFELKEFGDNGLEPPTAWRHPGSVSVVPLTANGVNVAVLLLPELPSGTQTPPERLVRQIETVLSKEREQADIIVALSPWGLWVERAYLESGADTPDLLLGSGPGVEVPGVIVAQGKTFWLRPYAKGKTVARIDILQLPSGEEDFTWTENGNIRFETPALTDSYIEDTNILSVLMGAGAE
ncbi:hypothetical protein SAMN02745704_01130 [Paucidesulfovibrio gracilis DSM 16080]|uniref:Uncharacterized protein n=1 Tax=Paucidesulfovibrio gracilis DSM 16080 TaxID=1121449 RepID=A0A1T4WP64_9BACT|nr:hypothetical protein [Paucidesulfovibrio gracilis]SKA78411.1 hypothetical protein SAMN02745704_01130 [Paucidesulfovibrio gracilis DSM 16080]